ncbi:hypothetical protein D3C71_1642110 [compost metagenome]
MAVFQHTARDGVIPVARHAGIELIDDIQQRAVGMQRQMAWPAARRQFGARGERQVAVCQRERIDAVAAQVGSQHTLAGGVEQHHVRVGGLLFGTRAGAGFLDDA